MKRSAASQSGGEGESRAAADRLREATRALERSQSAGIERQMRDAAERAQEMAQREREIGQDMDRALKSGQPDAGAGAAVDGAEGQPRGRCGPAGARPLQPRPRDPRNPARRRDAGWRNRRAASARTGCRTRSGSRRDCCGAARRRTTRGRCRRASRPTSTARPRGSAPPGAPSPRPIRADRIARSIARASWCRDWSRCAERMQGRTATGRADGRTGGRAGRAGTGQAGRQQRRAAAGAATGCRQWQAAGLDARRSDAG